MSKRKKLVKLAKRIWKPAVTVIVLVMLPFPVFAEGTCSSNDNEEKKAKAAEALKSTPLIIKKCFDSEATRLENIHMCLKPFCAVMLFTSCWITDSEKVPANVKIGSAALCSLSYAALTALEAKHAGGSK